MTQPDTSDIPDPTSHIPLAIVVAVADNGVIGREGDLPWRLPDDLKHFKQLTSGHAIVMGRETYESIGRPLPNRLNIVLSRSTDFAASGVTVVNDLDRAIEAAGDQPLFVIGGRAVYQAALPLADVLHVTHVRASVEGDVTFPPIDPKIWRKVDSQHHPADERHAYPFDFCRYERVSGRSW